MHPLSCLKKGGTSKHPEERTYRCCLSALAGFSTYLPFFSAGGIIPQVGWALANGALRR